MKIQMPEPALLDFIKAIRINKKLINKCKMSCGRYHPILLEKFMSSIFYEINSEPVRPFKADKN